MKKQKSNTNHFDLLSEEIVLLILDCLNDNSIDRKSFSLVCKSFYSIEAQHRKSLRPLRPEHLLKILNRYPNVTHLDLNPCPRIDDDSLKVISSVCNKTLLSIDLSRSRFFTHLGLSKLVMNCSNLVDIDLSNATEMRDRGAAAIAKASNLERLKLVRCKSITDIGISCIAVGCRKLRFISLKWCLGVGDLGVDLIAVKCKEIRSLDLSHLPISKRCLPPIMELEHLEDLILDGCFNIDDDGLSALKQGCKSLQTLDISGCQNVSHVGLSSLSSGPNSLRQLILSYGPPVTTALADSLQNLSKLQSIKLDGCTVTSSGLNAIGNWCISLKELSLSKCLGVEDEGLSSLVTKHTDLRKLNLTCCREITQISMADITNSCTSLTSLRMETCILVPRQAFILIGQRCHLLEELDLTDNEIDNEGLKSISRCSRLSTLKIGICLNITDEGLSQIGTCCSKLVQLDLYRSAGITDSGISAIARGCSGLESINISYCTNISNDSLISLSKCPMLKMLECRRCPHITSLGLSAIAIGCKQLTTLDIKKCNNVNDDAIIPLSHFSQNLRQINVSYSSVTDVGLMSLAGISCLQSLSILHLKGLRPSGLVAVLLECGGLTKVKLHASFKSLLPELIIEHLEARGCIFQWRRKVFQDELDTKFWKVPWEK